MQRECNCRGSGIFILGVDGGDVLDADLHAVALFSPDAWEVAAEVKALLKELARAAIAK